MSSPHSPIFATSIAVRSSFHIQAPECACRRCMRCSFVAAARSSQKGESGDTWALVLVRCHCGDFAGGLVAIVGARRKILWGPAAIREPAC